MIEALPEALSRSKASRAQRTVPSTSVSTLCPRRHRQMREKSLLSPTPALLTSTSSRPEFFSQAAHQRLHLLRLGHIDGLGLCRTIGLVVMASATSRAASPSRSATTT